ncbi:MAG: hypothetical protein KAJ19_28415 [Gammaproteobacteria bacterium]|nr:hypothetical protein [Gammaproteobacteria bacterium]
MTDEQRQLLENEKKLLQTQLRDVNNELRDAKTDAARVAIRRFRLSRVSPGEFRSNGDRPTTLTFEDLEEPGMATTILREPDSPITDDIIEEARVDAGEVANRRQCDGRAATS